MNMLSQGNLNGEQIFKNIEQQSFNNINAPKLAIKYCIIRECDFVDVNMENCDFLSSKIYNVFFKNVSFVCADIFSLWFSECVFENVNFSGAGIEDITFVNCHFNNCTFEDVGLKKCVFSNTLFSKIKPLSSSFILNQYNNCVFESCKFGGSFQYQIFDSCKFENTEIEYSVLKDNFGFSLKDGIQYIKNTIPIKETNQLYDFLLKECIDQKLFLNASFVSFNFETLINPQLILKSFDAIERMLSNEVLIRNDELLYLRRLYQYMYEQGMIAPIVIYQLINKIKKLHPLMNSNIAYAKSYESLSLIYNDLYFKFCEFCDNLQETLENLPEYETPLELYIDYEYEPNMPLADILNQCLPHTFIRIKSEQGSFHEIISMQPHGLEILNIFLQILGISIPIIYSEMKEKRKEKKAKTKLKKTVTFNISNQTGTKDSIKAIQNTCKTLAASDLLNNNLQGYNNSNIKEIKIKYNVNIQI